MSVKTTELQSPTSARSIHLKIKIAISLKNRGLRTVYRDSNYYFCPLFSAGAEHSCLDFREVCNRHDYLLSFVDNQLHGPALCETFGREETAVTETGQGRIMDNKKKTNKDPRI